MGKEHRKHPPAADALSSSTLGDGRLPKLDKSGLAFARDAIDGRGNSFTMAFLEQTLPRTSEEVIIDEVKARRYVSPENRSFWAHQGLCWVLVIVLVVVSQVV